MATERYSPAQAFASKNVINRIESSQTLDDKVNVLEAYKLNIEEYYTTIIKVKNIKLLTNDALIEHHKSDSKYLAKTISKNILFILVLLFNKPLRNILKRIIK